MTNSNKDIRINDQSVKANIQSIIVYFAKMIPSKNASNIFKMWLLVIIKKLDLEK